MLLAGDIGGTKTTLAIFSRESGLAAPLAEATLPSADYPSLEALAQDFLCKVALPIERASFGVAGPVVAGCATITNLPWKLTEEHLSRALHIPTVHLLNDLVAIGNGIPALRPTDIATLNTGVPADGAPIAVIAPGTGLGEAYITYNGPALRVHPSEGGHSDFAPADDVQIGLLRYLQSREGHVSYERVCSGIGIPNIYAYLKDSGAAPEPAWLAERLAATHDHPPVIITAALDTARPCEICIRTIRMFVSILGAEAGNLALKVLATGGVYIGGGIPPRILPFLREPQFLRAFTQKGRFADLLQNIPIHVILNPKVALLGAAKYGMAQ